MAMVRLIYCAGGGTKYSPIAIEEGYLYGCRSDSKPTQKVSFADINWKKPNLEKHVEFCRLHKPLLAVAPDVESEDQLKHALEYAEQLAQYATHVIIVPKAFNVIERIPRKPYIILGYSVPTKYAGLDMLGTWDFQGWPVHLLGGNPQNQLHLAHYLNVFSVDGNAATGAARHGVSFNSKTLQWENALDVPHGPELPYRAFRKSCQEIRKAWERFDGATRSEIVNEDC